MFQIMFILNNPEKCQDVLDAWDAAGVKGVTILASSGLGRLRARRGLHEDIPLMPSLQDFMQDEENLHRTLITIVRGQELVDRIVEVTQELLGDLNQPNTGILVVLPVLQAYGLDRHDEA